MPAENVEIVFVIDTSDSMQPYIDALKSNISCLLKPLQQMNYNIRLGIVAHSVTGHGICSIRFLSPCNQSLLKKMYGGQYNIDDFFTQDLDRFMTVVDSLTTQGDEDTLLGIDFALDFPFGSLKDTRRVIAFFSDECIENGEMSPNWQGILPRIVEKIMARKVMLFGFVPKSSAALTLSEAERSEITFIDPSNFGQISFNKLLSAMGKSISVSTLQLVKEPSYSKALFGQDLWTTGKGDKNFHDNSIKTQ